MNHPCLTPAARRKTVGTALSAVMLAVAGACAGALPRTPVIQGAGPADGVHQPMIGGARLWYRVAGRAAAGVPPVVFLHGGPGQGSAHFDALVGPYLEPTLRMVYFDQRGSGHSERPASGDYALTRLVQDIEELRQALGVERIAVVGHSFGAVLALEYAAAYPQRVSHLIVVAGLWDTPYQCRLRLQYLIERRPQLASRVPPETVGADGRRGSACNRESTAFASSAEREAWSLESMFPDPAVSARMDSVNAARGVRNTGELGRALFSSGLLDYRFTALDRVRMPALVIAGRHDGAARPEGLRTLAAGLPNGRFVEFERAGHFVYLDEPRRFAAELTRFVTRR